MIPLTSLRHLVVDMDGVLWHGSQALPHMAESLALLRQADISFVLATNNASKSVEEYQEKLAGFGATVSPDEIMTSPQATAAYLERHAPEARIYAIGEPGLSAELRKRHLHVVPQDNPTGVTHVVVGWDRTLTYAKLADACLLIRAGAAFIGTNPDRTYPSERGIIPGNGSILALLQTATDVEPIIIGKPQPEMVVQSMLRMGGTAQDTAAVGDRLETDILGGQNAGLATILVLSGITSREEAAANPIKADYIFQDLWEVAQALAGRR